MRAAFVLAVSLAACATSPPPPAPVVVVDAPLATAVPVVEVPAPEPKEVVLARGGKVGQRAPHFDATYMTGHGPRTLDDARGLVAVVEFWATYCQPCRRSLPAHQALVKAHPGQVAAFAISVDDPHDVSPEAITTMGKDLGVGYALLWDTHQSTAKAYMPTHMPTTYVIDRAGVIRHVHGGFSTSTKRAIDEQVKALLQE